MDSDTAPTFGYLLVVEDDRHGYTGGLLVVCDRGRPLEFHCTEPVRPSRAQQILFGSTLRSYLLGEQIGGALLEKAKLPIGLLLAVDNDAAEAGRRAGLPTAVADGGTGAGADAGFTGDDEARRLIDHLAVSIDPVEPFERVREAICEAQRLVVDDASAEEPQAPQSNVENVVGGSRAVA